MASEQFRGPGRHAAYMTLRTNIGTGMQATPASPPKHHKLGAAPEVIRALSLILESRTPHCPAYLALAGRGLAQQHFARMCVAEMLVSSKGSCRLCLRVAWALGHSFGTAIRKKGPASHPLPISPVQLFDDR